MHPGRYTKLGNENNQLILCANGILDEIKRMHNAIKFNHNTILYTPSFFALSYIMIKKNITPICTKRLNQFISPLLNPDVRYHEKYFATYDTLVTIIANKLARIFPTTSTPMPPTVTLVFVSRIG